MALINSNYKKLQAGYLFSQIAKRTADFQKEHPGVELLRLGIGNTTEALTPTVLSGLLKGVEKLSDVKTYTGYGDEQGDIRLRLELVNWYKERGIILESSEVFISDGAKPDTANMGSLFSEKNIIAVSDPAYPVYVDSNVIAGRTKNFKNGLYEGMVYMTCNEKNGFVPKIPNTKVDVIYLCSPNNPTGAVFNKKQLEEFVRYAIKNKAVIIYDSAYAWYIKDSKLPKSIYEIKDAKKCAIEISSFSKIAGFTGVRLGWCVVPLELVCEDSQPGELNKMWNRRQTTMFNGASNIVQEGGLAILSKKGQKECLGLINYYMKNATIIKKGLEKMGLTVFGGVDAPYLWVKTPKNMSSWEFFDKLLQEAGVVCTPGVGFGPSGEGYVRFSAFGHKENVEKAVKSIQRSVSF